MLKLFIRCKPRAQIFSASATQFALLPAGELKYIQANCPRTSSETNPNPYAGSSLPDCPRRSRIRLPLPFFRHSKLQPPLELTPRLRSSKGPPNIPLRVCAAVYKNCFWMRIRENLWVCSCLEFFRKNGD